MHVVGNAYVNGTLFLFEEEVEFAERLFDVADAKVKDLSKVFVHRADFRVMREYLEISGIGDTAVTLEAWVKRGIHIAFPSGITFSAVLVPSE